MAQYSDDTHRQVVRLLSLKKYEVPPPGFFADLPRRVTLALATGASPRDVPMHWWERVWSILREEPLMAGSYAALCVGAALFGVSVYQMALDQKDLVSLPANLGVAATGGAMDWPGHGNASFALDFMMAPAVANGGITVGSGSGLMQPVFYRQTFLVRPEEPHRTQGNGHR